MSDKLKNLSPETQGVIASMKARLRAADEAEEKSELTKARARIEALELCLKDCADEAESWIENYYKDTKEWPSELRRYERDIECVKEARKLLKPEPPQ